MSTTLLTRGLTGRIGTSILTQGLRDRREEIVILEPNRPEIPVYANQNRRLVPLFAGATPRRSFDTVAQQALWVQGIGPLQLLENTIANPPEYEPIYFEDTEEVESIQSPQLVPLFAGATPRRSFDTVAQQALWIEAIGPLELVEDTINTPYEPAESADLEEVPVIPETQSPQLVPLFAGATSADAPVQEFVLWVPGVGPVPLVENNNNV